MEYLIIATVVALVVFLLWESGGYVCPMCGGPPQNGEFLDVEPVRCEKCQRRYRLRENK